MNMMLQISGVNIVIVGEKVDTQTDFGGKLNMDPKGVNSKTLNNLYCNN